MSIPLSGGDVTPPHETYAKVVIPLVTASPSPAQKRLHDTSIEEVISLHETPVKKLCKETTEGEKKMIRVRKFVLKKKVGLYLFPLCLTQPCHLQPDLHTQFIILPQPRKRHFLHLLRLPPQNRHHRPIAYHHVHQSHHVMR